MKENLLVTKYFFPISEGGTKRFFGGIYFDNPRTKSEIKFVADLIKKINYSTDRPFPEENNQVSEGYITLRWIIEKFYINNKDNSMVKKYYNEAKYIKNVYYALAKMWVIVRCDDLLDDTAKDKFFIFCKNGEEKKCNQIPNIILSYERIIKLIKFLSFMTNGYSYTNDSIIINDFFGFIELPKFHNFFPFVLTTCTIDKKSNSNYEPPLVTFDILFGFYNKIIELLGNNYNEEKFLFICDTISNFSDLRNKNPKMYLLGIVGLIEMLLTHNPDASRFNIEDSISKQFVRKLKYVVYKNDSAVNLEVLEKELKLAYRIRSDIAHGNFGASSEKNLRDLLNFYHLKIGGKGEAKE